MNSVPYQRCRIIEDLLRWQKAKSIGLIKHVDAHSGRRRRPDLRPTRHVSPWRKLWLTRRASRGVGRGFKESIILPTERPTLRKTCFPFCTDSPMSPPHPHKLDHSPPRGVRDKWLRPRRLYGQQDEGGVYIHPRVLLPRTLWLPVLTMKTYPSDFTMRGKA